MENEIGIEQMADGIATESVRPKDLKKDEKMRLVLPDDVHERPSQEQLKVLTTRLLRESQELEVFEVEGDRGRTNSVPIPSEYGNDAVLVAIDRDGLGIMFKSDMSDSPRLSPVGEMVSKFEIANIPPIFIAVDDFVGEGVKPYIRDGAHRTYSALQGNTPYLLAYLKEGDLNLVRDRGIEYREVERIN
jgi:hypothetical protein